MSSILAVPIHLDALYFKKNDLVTEPMANFSRLADVDRQRDVNFNLKWEVEVFPRREDNNYATYNRHYQANFLTGNYCLEEDAPDLIPREHKAIASDEIDNPHLRRVAEFSSDGKLILTTTSESLFSRDRF